MTENIKLQIEEFALTEIDNHLAKNIEGEDIYTISNYERNLTIPIKGNSEEERIGLQNNGKEIDEYFNKIVDDI